MKEASLTISSYPEEAEKQESCASQSIQEQAVPIIAIIDGLPESPVRVHFCYLILNRALTSLINNQYSDFDAHTTSNCCHGMALFARELILKARQENLAQIQIAVRERLDQKIEDPFWKISDSLFRLSQLYILNYICESTSKVLRSAKKKLINIALIGTSFSEKLINKLQKNYANLIAMRYEYYLFQVSGKIKTCNVLIDLWGKYATHSYLRSDPKGRYYASNLYSMQIVLAYLIHSKATIALVNDILDPTGNMHPWTRILRGDGKENFSLLKQEDLEDPKSIHETVIVFRGCAKTGDPERLMAELDNWLHRFPHLVLANDVFYPQFPKVDDDFHTHPIVPEEDILQELMIEQGQIPGVSAKNPVLYCLSHIYPSSLQQVHQESDPSPMSLRILFAAIALSPLSQEIP